MSWPSNKRAFPSFTDKSRPLFEKLWYRHMRLQGYHTCVAFHLAFSLGTRALSKYIPAEAKEANPYKVVELLCIMCGEDSI